MPLRFGTVRLDPDRRQLVRDGREQHLSPKAFDLLLALVRARPAVVTKDALMAQVWPDAFVADANLAVLIREVRAAIGDPARSPRFIRTHHAVGYSFIGEVSDSPRPPELAPQFASAWLVVGERSVPLAQGDTLIGRDPACDLPIPHASISRRHARLVLTGQQAIIEDLGSKNGTKVDGRLIDRPTPLGPHATLTLGAVVAEFFVESATDATTMTVQIEK